LSGVFSPTATGSPWGGGGGGSTTPGNARNYDPAYGGIPFAPNLGTAAADVAAINKANMPAYLDMMHSFDMQSATDALAALNQNDPGWSAAQAASMKNIGNELAGVIPPDVMSAISQGAAERGVLGGMGVGPNTNTALLRALGLTSLGLQAQGQTDLTAATARTPVGKLMDPAAMTQFFVTPQQELDTMWLANQLAAAPDPRTAAETELANLKSALGLGMGAAGGGGRGVSPTTWTTAGGGWGPDMTTPGPTMISGSGVDRGGRFTGSAADWYNNIGWTQPGPVAGLWPGMSTGSPTDYGSTITEGGAGLFPGMGGAPAGLGTGGEGVGGPWWNPQVGLTTPDMGMQLGTVPDNTYYNPATNTSNFDPFGTDYYGL
jgi:hypothetical protein